jgi:hypothetical protein
VLGDRARRQKEYSGTELGGFRLESRSYYAGVSTPTPSSPAIRESLRGSLPADSLGLTPLKVRPFNPASGSTDLSGRQRARSWADCRLIQKSGLVSRASERSQAVSGVMPRLPLIISFIRYTGMPGCAAKAIWEIPKGARNSCPNIRPGCTGMRFSGIMAIPPIHDSPAVVPRTRYHSIIAPFPRPPRLSRFD